MPGSLLSPDDEATAPGASSDVSRGSVRPVDARALASTLRRLNRADAAPWLHGEVARRMGERLPIIKLQPQRVLDWGAFLGASQGVLAAAYPKAQLAALEPDLARRAIAAVSGAKPWWSPRRWTGATIDRVAGDEPAPASAQLLWSNMHLHAVADPQALMRQWQRATAVDGFLMFSTLGPGSLLALRDIYAAQGWPPPFAPFVDMHDLGDMLVAAGFADPVMDQETLTLTWPSAGALLAELRSLGGNADPRRSAGLRTPRWRERLGDALAAHADASGRLALDFELVYGHAFKPPPRPRVAAQTAVPLEDMRAMTRAGRRRA